MKPDEFAKAMSFLGLAYNKEFEQAQVEVWYTFFRDTEYSAFRQAVGSNILIDDFVIQARNAEFTQDYVSEAGQPLTLEVSFEDTNYWDTINMNVTSDYDEEYNLRQNFTVLDGRKLKLFHAQIHFAVQSYCFRFHISIS